MAKLSSILLLASIIALIQVKSNEALLCYKCTSCEASYDRNVDEIEKCTDGTDDNSPVCLRTLLETGKYSKSCSKKSVCNPASNTDKSKYCCTTNLCNSAGFNSKTTTKQNFMIASFILLSVGWVINQTK